jgi:hypothetical protein
VAIRKTFYESLEQLQRDLDAYLAFYNRGPSPHYETTYGRA